MRREDLTRQPETALFDAADKMPERVLRHFYFDCGRLLNCLIEAQVARGSTHAHCALAARGDPLLLFCRPVLKLARVDVERDPFAFVRTEVNAIEGHQSSNRELNAIRNLARSTEIDLRYLIGSNRALVPDVHSDVKTAVGSFCDCQAGIVEAGIAEPVTEGEERLDILFVEPAVPDIHAFAVNRLLLGRA